MQQITIAIQARSTSKRFPRKVFEVLDGKTLLQCIIDAAQSCARYLNKASEKNHLESKVILVVPYKDEIVGAFGGSIDVVEGPEDDVLARYYAASQLFNSDYMVRLTADCPLLPAHIISKHINLAVSGMYDYVSNVHEDIRTSVDGFDVEVVSQRAIKWLFENAKGVEREHVTIALRKSPPQWLRVAHVIGPLDMSGIKLSVDTPEDLERVREEYAKIKKKLKAGEAISGRASLHRFG